MHRSAFAPGFLFLLAGGPLACSAPRAAPVVLPPSTALVAEPPPSDFATFPVAVGAVGPTERLPLSITRIVSEQHIEMDAVTALAAPVGDARGRERAARDVSAVADELREIETALRAGALESERLDEAVIRLQRLQTRIALLHDALRVAAGPASAVEKE